MADQFDEIIQRMAAERASAALTVDKPAPAAAGRANAIARQTGLPAETVDRNLPSLEQQVQNARAKALFGEHPGLATWAGNPRNAAVGAGDMDQLAKNARYWQQVGRASGSITSTPEVEGTLWNGLKGIGSSLLEGVKGVQAQVSGLFGDYLPDMTPQRSGIPSLGNYSAENDKRMRARTAARIDAVTPEYKSTIARGLYGGVSSLAAQAPGIALGLMTGSTGVGLAAMGVQQAVPAYNKYRDRGATRAQAATGGALEGGIEVASEKLGMGFIVEKLGKVGAGHFISGFLGRELPSEMAATLGQNAVDTAIANPNKTWAQYAKEQPDALVQTAIGTLVAGGFFTGVNKVAQHYAQQAQAGESADHAVALDKAMETAAESQTRAHDPEAFKQLVALHTDDGPIENIFVPAESIATYFQSMGVDYHADDFWGSYSDQIDEAIHTGGDVVIPTPEAAAHLSGTPAWEALKGDVRTSPGGASLSEAKSLADNHAQTMEMLGSQISEQLDEIQKADAPRQAIYQDIRDKLTNAGFTQDAAHTNAELVAQRYATRAERMGQDLTGKETGKIAVNAILPPNLAPIVAADPGRVALSSVINVMRRARGVKTAQGPSLLEWIAKNGGIEDRGGDIASMGGAEWHRGKPGRRKLIRATNEGQGVMLGQDGQQNTNTPDELAVRAQEAGYFPAGERPTVNDLLDAVGEELRGKPRHVEGPDPDRSQAAADELAQILDQSGLDPAKATDAEIGQAVDAYRQAAQGDYQQTFGDGPRGQITFQPGGVSIIDLFQSRNMSTFAHEMGHQWLEELRADATSEGAPDQLKADWQAVQDWFKANGQPVTDGTIPVEAHELWARGTERFLMEGKAPSSILRRVFDAFKSWMLHIYQVADNLRAPITPEIRDVMQRLVATDEEIAAANERQQLEQSFDQQQLGMTDQEFAALQKIAAESKDEAHDALLFKTMAAIRRSRTKAWKDEQANVKADVTERVNQRREFKALHLLRTGRMLDDPEAAPIRAKLDKAWLLETYGEGVLGTLPRGVPPIFADTETMHADDLAEMTGFGSGDEMVRTLITLEDRKREIAASGDKRSVRQVLIDEETAREMQDRHGDVLNDGSIEEEALAAVHNDKQGEVIAAQLRSLGRRSGRQPTPYSVAKDWARDKIANSEVKDATSGAIIQGYSRAAAKAARAAEAAMLKGDVDETYRQKQAQMLNNALIAEAGRVRDLVIAARDRLAGYAKRRTIKSMDQDYLDQIHGLLEQVEFKQRSRADVERQVSFEAWAAEQEAAGHEVVVPGSFAASLGTTNWTRLTTEKLLGLDDTVKQIAHLGRFKQKLLDGKEDRDYQEVVAEALSGIGNLPPRKPIEFDPSWSDRMKSKVEHIDAGLLKMETIVDWLDGDNSEGVFNRMAFRPIAEAQVREQDMTGDYFARIREAMGAVPKVERWLERVVVPELTDPETGRPLNAQRQRLVAMALNMGNEGNVQRLTDGYGWNRDAVLAVLNRELTVEDWRFVQRTWDIIDTLWPEISAMERRVNGVEPEKVEARPIETVAGTLRGGYYPAVYDTARDLKAERNAGKATDLLEATYTRATTRASSTKERTDKVKRPILLDVGVINRHLGEVIHDITHREALMNANKFLSDTRIQKAVNETLGPEIRKQFQPWLKHVANQWAADRAGNEGFGKFMGKLRANTTAVGMGFRASTVITQVAGFANSQEVVGGTWLAPAIAQASAHPVETYRFVTERSGEVRNRMDNLDRDIGAALRSLDTRPQMKAAAIPRDAARFMYHGIGYADRMVVIPTWVAAYNKALAGGVEESQAVYAADKAIRQSQGAGAAKDLAAIQRGTGRWGEAAKLMTMFYSYFSAVYQRQRKLGRDVRLAEHRDLPALLARGWWLVAVPPVLSALLVGKGPGDDEDWGLWSFKQMLLNSLGPIPVVRDLAQPLWNKVAGTPGFGASLSPVQRAYDTFVATGGDAGKIARGEDTKRATRDVLETTGYATGLIPGQVAAATQFLVDVGYGDQDPETAGDWYRGLTTGKMEPPKKR